MGIRSSWLLLEKRFFSVSRPKLTYRDGVVYFELLGGGGVLHKIIILCTFCFKLGGFRAPPASPAPQPVPSQIPQNIITTVINHCEDANTYGHDVFVLFPVMT